MAYLIGILAMIPFAVTSWYTGPVASALGGADIAIFAGLATSALSYLFLARTIDFAYERQVADDQKREYGDQAVTFGEAVRTDSSTGSAARVGDI